MKGGVEAWKDTAGRGQRTWATTSSLSMLMLSPSALYTSTSPIRTTIPGRVLPCGLPAGESRASSPVPSHPSPHTAPGPPKVTGPLLSEAFQQQCPLFFGYDLQSLICLQPLHHWLTAASSPRLPSPCAHCPNHTHLPPPSPFCRHVLFRESSLSLLHKGPSDLTSA